MTLRELVRSALGMELPAQTAGADGEVGGVEQDSRRVGAGFLFVARPGGTSDGHRFADEALGRGAIAVVGERSDRPAWGRVPYIAVPDARRAVASLAAAFQGHPARTLLNLGVTGTDGKTTTAFLLHHLLSARYRCGLLSTAAVRAGQQELEIDGHFTTPEAPQIQAFLAGFRDRGCSHSVIEASSHGFAQRRLDGIAYRVGVFTNLSPEHLDFHGSLEAYLDTKLELARRSEVMVVNQDDPFGEAFAATSRHSVSYGLDAQADWRAGDIASRPGSLEFSLSWNRGRRRALLPMVGSYNVANALGAVAAAVEAGLPAEEAIDRLALFPGVPGRMQVVQAEPFAVVVDFAHTPPALAKALSALRETTPGRLIVVIGAAGERDPGKRAPLGERAAAGADLAVFTEEDSRSEDPEAILEQMAAGARSAGGRPAGSFLCIPDRRDAITAAIAAARPGDLVLLAGKGHERTLERATEVLPWDEVQEAREALRKRF